MSLSYIDCREHALTRSLTVTVAESPPPQESTGGGGGGESRRTSGRGGGGGRTTCRATLFEGIRISEFLPNPVGKDADGEWIELENTLENTVSLCGWEIDDSEEGSKEYLLDTYQLAAHAFLLLPREQT